MAEVQYYYAQRKKAESGQTGTVTYDLPESGTIPWIVVRAFSTPTASTDPALPLNDAITKIEIVDGGTVIQSLSGNQVHALSMIRGNPVRSSTEVNDNAVEGYDDFLILLGGTFNGRKYAPDFSKFTNPQIKITWDYSLTTTEFGMSCDADTSPAMKFTVLCKVVRGAHDYSHGYVKSKEVKTWTQAASTETKVEIPRDGLLIGIGFEGGYDAKAFTDDLNEVKLSFDNGAWEPLHLYAEEIVKAQEEWFGRPFELSFAADLVDAKELDLHMGYFTFVAGTCITSAGRSFEFQSTHNGIETVSLNDVATPTAIAAYETVFLYVKGFLPYNMWYVPARVLLDGKGDTIDTNKYKRIDLFCTSGSSASTSSTPAIICEYLKTA